jgi:hypothetical protein
MSLSKSELAQVVQRRLRQVITAGITEQDVEDGEMECDLSEIEVLLGRATMRQLDALLGNLQRMLDKKKVLDEMDKIVEEVTTTK